MNFISPKKLMVWKKLSNRMMLLTGFNHLITSVLRTNKYVAGK